MAATVAELAAAVSVEGLPQAEAGLASFGANVDAAAAKQGNAAQQSAQHDEALRKVGNTALVAGGLIVGGLGVAIGTTANFDKALSGVAAVSGATGGELAKLRDAAIDAGQATAFSASDAATAEGELAKAGLSTAQILGGGLSGALSLAAAGQLDLATAATITAQTLNEFKLNGDQASHVADVLAAGANKSAADVQGLGEGLSNVGGLANQAGVGLEQTVGVLSLFSDNALSGAEGGTALKSMLLALQAPSQEAQATMKQLGINAYDAQGNFVGLEKFAGNLKGALGGLTEQQRDAAMATIFGSYGIRAASLLYDAGAGKVRDYTNAVNDQGAAGRMAGVQMDNLSGDIEQLKGSIETGLIQSGSGATSVLRFMAQGATDVVNGFTNLDPAVQTGITGLLAFSGAGLTAIGVGLKIKEKLDDMRASADFSPGLAKGVEVLGKLAGASAIAGVSLSMVGDESAKSAIGVAGMAASGAMLGSTFGPAGTAIGGVAGALAGMTAHVLDGGESVDEYRAKIAGLSSELDALGSKQATSKFVDNLGDLDHALLMSGGVAAVRGIRDELNALGTKSPADVAKVVDGLKAMHDEDGKPLFTGKALGELDGIVGRVNAKYKEHAANARDAASTNQELSGSADLVGGSMSSVADKFKEADQRASDFNTTLDHLLGKGLDAEQANIRWKDSIDTVTQGIAQNGATLDINTEAGRKNRENLADSTQDALSYAEAQYNLHGSIDEVNGIVGSQIGYLEQTAEQLGYTSDQALGYTEDVLGIPADARTDIHSNADLAKWLVDQVTGSLNQVDGRNVNATVTVTDAASGTLNSIIGGLNRISEGATAGVRSAFGLAHGGVAFGAHGLVSTAGMIVGPNQPVVIGEGLSREAVVPFDNFGDMTATIRNTGRASDFVRAAIAAGGEAPGMAAWSGGPTVVHNHYVTVNVQGHALASRDQIAEVVHEALLYRQNTVGDLRLGVG